MVELLRHEFSDREIVGAMKELQFCSAHKAIMKGIEVGLDPKEVIQGAIHAILILPSNESSCAEESTQTILPEKSR